VVRDDAEAVVSCPRCGPEARVDQLLRRACIPDRYRSKNFAGYHPDHPSQEEALKHSIKYMEAFPDVSRGLLFQGRCGVGKTHLAVAILRYLLLKKQVSARFVDETELLRRLQYSYGPSSPETEREVLQPLYSAELLIWDDLGAGRPTEWVAETIRTILNHRYTRGKQILLTTNLPLKSAPGRFLEEDLSRAQNLEERIGAPLYSRIMEMCQIVEIAGSDYRRHVYKASLDARRV
jgi:DNA replication protein DnaC